MKRFPSPCHGILYGFCYRAWLIAIHKKMTYLNIHNLHIEIEAINHGFKVWHIAHNALKQLCN